MRWGVRTGFVVAWLPWASTICSRSPRTRRYAIWRRSQRPLAGTPLQRPWQSVEVWSQSLDEAAWRRIDVRDGSKGPLVVEVVKRRVVARTQRRQQGAEELLAVMRYRDRDQDAVVKVDYYLSNAVPETPLWELARVAKAEHRIEECLQRSKSEAGLADMRCVTGRVGSIIKRFRYWPHGSWCGRRSGGKNGRLP